MDFKNVFFNIKDYKLYKSRRLGKGNFGIVYLAESNKSHEQFAVKIIDVDDSFDGNDQMLIMRESSLLFNLKHSSIIKFYGISFRSFDGPAILQPTLLMEYVTNGSLKEIIDKERHSIADFDWSYNKKYICIMGIANAMRYLHKNGILHLDLKPENILIDENYFPKICDFGLSRCFPKSLSKSMKLISKCQIGTPLYMAPELLDDKKSYEYTKEVDVYAFSMIIYEVLTTQNLFFELGNDVTMSELKEKIINGLRPSLTHKNVYLSEKMKKLLEKCWSQKVEDRPSFEEIFQKLSSDFSYSYYNVNEKEINEYLENINTEIVEDHYIGKQFQKDRMQFDKELKKSEETGKCDELADTKPENGFNEISQKLKEENENLKMQIEIIENENKKLEKNVEILEGIVFESQKIQNHVNEELQNIKNANEKMQEKEKLINENMLKTSIEREQILEIRKQNDAILLKIENEYVKINNENQKIKDEYNKINFENEQINDKKREIKFDFKQINVNKQKNMEEKEQICQIWSQIDDERVKIEKTLKQIELEKEEIKTMQNKINKRKNKYDNGRRKDHCQIGINTDQSLNVEYSKNIFKEYEKQFKHHNQKFDIQKNYYDEIHPNGKCTIY